ncbi:MAG: GAF domain-containing protein, partial [Spirulinaceae cyanobacterium]
MKILVVEDDEIERMVLYKALIKARADIEMESANTCESAIASLKQQRDFECVFLDYRLPDGSGRELVEKIRRAEIKVPLVVLIAQGDEHYAADLIKAGASDYIPQRKVSSESLARSLHNSVRLYHAEQQADFANRRLQESEEMYRLVVEGSNDGIWDWDLDSHKVYANDRLLEMVGLSPQGVTVNYQLLKKLLHLGDRLKISRAVRAHLRKQAKFEVEFRLRHVSGEYLYCVARGKAQRDSSGKPLRMSGIVSDITERKRTEGRTRFLTEATEVLSASLDYQTTLENLAQLAVPRLADWCAIDVVDSQGDSRRIAVTHIEPSKEALVRQLDCSDETKGYCPVVGYGQVIHRGKSAACFYVSEENLAQIARNEEHLERLKSLNIHSYICVPLKTGERTLGSILFVWSESGRCYTQDDFKLAEDLAHRAALAIENARLFQEAHQASEELRQANAILGEQQQQLRTLQQLTNLLNHRLTDLPDLLRVMARSVCEAIPGAQICFIALFNTQCNRMMLTVTAGVGEESLSLEDASSSKSLLRQVFLTGQPKLIQSPQQETGSAKSLPQTIYAVPIKSVKSGSLGILAIGNWENPTAFDKEGQYLLTAVGEQAAIAID